MQVTFWGTRGSIPVPGPDTVRYGGNTSCVSLQVDGGPLFIFDSGTGIRNLGKILVAKPEPVTAVLFLSHSHWDHIQGFPLFAPLYRKDFTLSVLGCPSHPTSLQEILARQQDRTVFPVPLEALLANISFSDYCMLEETYNGVHFKTLHLNHPGGSCGFRVSHDDKVFVYMTDNELTDGEHWDKCVGYCRDADLLIHDAQYTAEELPTKRGWGHSSIYQVTQLAMESGVKRLALFHHDPDRSDSGVDRLVELCKDQVAKSGSSLEVFAAAEGNTETV